MGKFHWLLKDLPEFLIFKDFSSGCHFLRTFRGLCKPCFIIIGLFTELCMSTYSHTTNLYLPITLFQNILEFNPYFNQSNFWRGWMSRFQICQMHSKQHYFINVSVFELKNKNKTGFKFSEPKAPKSLKIPQITKYSTHCQFLSKINYCMIMFTFEGFCLPTLKMQTISTCFQDFQSLTKFTSMDDRPVMLSMSFFGMK